jgi:hypothetical protein
LRRCDDSYKDRKLLLKDVVLVSSCTSNLISLEQLQNSDISYQDENSKMTLIKDECTVTNVQ